MSERDEILAKALTQHDILYGTAHCDRKYVLSCARLPEIILTLPKERPMTDTEEPQDTPQAALRRMSGRERDRMQVMDRLDEADRMEKAATRASELLTQLRAMLAERPETDEKEKE